MADTSPPLVVGTNDRFWASKPAWRMAARVDMSLSRRTEAVVRCFAWLPRGQVTGSEGEAAGQHRWRSMTGIGDCCRPGIDARTTQISLDP